MKAKRDSCVEKEKGKVCKVEKARRTREESRGVEEEGRWFRR